MKIRRADPTTLALLMAWALAPAVPSIYALGVPVQQTSAFVGVTVVPMDREVVLPNQTVIVRDGIVAEIGLASEVRVPDGASLIDGSGKYLMPGLADLHVHLQNEIDLAAYLAHGITTVLDLGAAPRILGWRQRLEDGDLLGPHLLASYFIDGVGGRFNIEEGEASAREAIRSAGALGYDYIKVYNSLTTSQFDGIMEEANTLGLTVVGHGVREPGLKYILEAGQAMVSHAEEYLYTHFGNRMDRSLIPRAVDLTLRTGVYVLPNLSAYEAISAQAGRPAAVDSFLAMSEVQYLHPSFRSSWRGGRYSRASQSERAVLAQRLIFLRELTKAFSDAGVPLLLGSDSPFIPGLYPGESIHNDLRNMIEAGLTPYESLSAGTRTAGEFVRGTVADAPLFGVVTQGARADLVLLESNPLDDVRHVRNPVGVMVNGRWSSTGTIRESIREAIGR
jgi:hypothetical protein